MGSRLYIKLKNKRDANKADKFLQTIPENKTLEELKESIYITAAVDIRRAKKEEPDMLDFYMREFGRSSISIFSSLTDEAEKKGYSFKDIYELQTKVLEKLNKKFEVTYINSGAFSEEEWSFTIDQAKRITNNGKLLEFEDYISDDYLKTLLFDSKDVKPSTYKSGDKVIIFSDLYKKFQITRDMKIYPHIGKIVTIDFACVDGTYYIKEDEDLKISDDLIDCKVDDVVTPDESYKISSNQLLAKVKNAGEDFEWYPTTKEIIKAMYEDVLERNYKGDFKNTHKSILDIGAGNGKLFSTIKEISKDREEKEDAFLTINNAYAIEKSQVLLNSLDDDIFIIGTDFNAQTLIDKQADIIFCNPPYFEYEQWAERIINEANCETIYLVIPKRWVTCDAILNAIKKRGTAGQIIGEFDFESSEDRKARAKVSLVKIHIRNISSYNTNRIVSDPFDIWFDKEFTPNTKKSSYGDLWEQQKVKKEKLQKLVKGGNLIERLEELYNKELEHLILNYKKVATLDSEILEELNVSVEGLREALKLKIGGLKNLYWQELFDNLSTITCRLTSKSRDKMTTKLFSHVNVDFTKENAYAIVLWAIKNANKYYDSQLLDVYYDLTKEQNVKLYKSNKHMTKDNWRYERDEMSHYALDYRIVDHHYNAIDLDYSGNIRGMGRNAATKIKDIIVVAKNLGFNVISSPDDFDWMPGKSKNFLMNYLGDECAVFAEIKAFKNGNLHFKFNQKFMKAFNIEAARLNGWIKSPKEASEEFDITMEEASEMFQTNHNLLPSNLGLLLPHIEKEEKEIPKKAVNNMPYDSKQIEFFAETGTLF